MKRTTTTYLSAWLAYCAFNFLLYPYLGITVMLVSIPLAMLGGWLYGYRGATFTTILTIPCHYVILRHYSDAPALIHEAFNPLGLGTALLFSSGTTLLRSTRERYIRLNGSLGEMVAERTAELEQLTRYLLEMETQEHSTMLSTLLKTPFKQLEGMRESSKMLVRHLQDSSHPLAGRAKNIAAVVDKCIRDLKELQSMAPCDELPQAELSDSIRTLTEQLSGMSGVNVRLADGADWQTISAEKCHDLCNIVHEAVSNALQHAKPSRIEIGFEQDPDATTIYIENNGKPLPDGGTEGMGLPLMRYRASRIGASVELSTTDHGLTRCTCHVPSAEEGQPIEAE